MAQSIDVPRASVTLRDYATVRCAYKAKFGETPPGPLLKSVSLMDGGTQDLSRAMQDAVEAGQRLDFNEFAVRFFEHLAGSPHANE